MQFDIFMFPALNHFCVINVNFRPELGVGFTFASNKNLAYELKIIGSGDNSHGDNCPDTICRAPKST